MNYFDLHREVRDAIEYFETIRDLMDNTPVEQRDLFLKTSLKMNLADLKNLVTDARMLSIAESVATGTKGICRYCGNSLQPEFDICGPCEEQFEEIVP